MSDHITPAAGIDTAKGKLDVAIHGSCSGSSPPFTVANDRAGWRRLACRLAKAGVGRVGIEASGGYERGVVASLRTRGFTVLVLQPLQVKAYARLHLHRAKNDRLDAMLIAACAAVLDEPALAADPRLPNLADALTFLEQTEEDIARIKTRLEHIEQPRLRRLALADIGRMKARRAAELARLAEAVRAHDDLARRLDLLHSIPGIGLRTALCLLVRMPELGRIGREQAAALVGLAPFDDDSGRHHGQRHIAGGRSRVRRSVYAAALGAAFRWNPALIALYRRLRAAAKPHKAALVACARKLVIYANTVLARGTPWHTETLPAAA
jgi:transposase